jgi:hypothetical protein
LMSLITMVIMAMYLTVTVSVVLASPDRNPCPQAVEEWHDPQTELCCSFGITDKFNEHKQKLDCCHSMY